jgi:chromosome segregation ATPase
MRMLVTAAFFGVLLVGSAGTKAQAKGPCDDLDKAVDAARASFQEATKAVFALEDKISIKKEQIANMERLLAPAAAADQQAYNEWQAKIDRLNACLSRPRNNACTSELQAVKDATDKLNAKHKVRRDYEAQLKGYRDELEALESELDAARDTWAAALKALQDAQRAKAGCRRAA